MIVIKLSGGDVIEVQNDSAEEVEVRQYHRDFAGGDDLIEDDAGHYLVIYPEVKAGPFETYTALHDFLDGYTNERGVIQGDPATIAAEAVGAGRVAADDQYRVQFED